MAVVVGELPVDVVLDGHLGVVDGTFLEIDGSHEVAIDGVEGVCISVYEHRLIVPVADVSHSGDLPDGVLDIISGEVADCGIVLADRGRADDIHESVVVDGDSGCLELVERVEVQVVDGTASVIDDHSVAVCDIILVMTVHEVCIHRRG